MDRQFDNRTPVVSCHSDKMAMENSEHGIGCRTRPSNFQISDDGYATRRWIYATVNENLCRWQSPGSQEHIDVVNHVSICPQLLFYRWDLVVYPAYSGRNSSYHFHIQ